jgi:hypothetical protein
MNKTTITMLLFAAVCGPNLTAQYAPKATPAATVTAPPKDAVKNPDGTFTWTDKQGKKWLYRRAGTGYSRTEAPTASEILQIPKDAMARPDGSFLWTDKDGKQWAFRQSPFGVMKYPAPAQADAPPAAPAAVNKNVRVIDKGETVRFEKPTPFGVVAYEKKKTELTDDERRMYEASKPQSE